MAGHNGGFNPYRDSNGEFTNAGGAGGKGRSRKGGAGAGSTPTGKPGAPPRVGGRGAKMQRANPRQETQFWSDNTGHREGLSSPQVGYRGKGQNIYGAKATPRTKGNYSLNPGATWKTPAAKPAPKPAPRAASGRPGAPAIATSRINPSTSKTNPTAKAQFFSNVDGRREGLASPTVSYRGKGTNWAGAPRTKKA